MSDVTDSPRPDELLEHRSHLLRTHVAQATNRNGWKKMGGASLMCTNSQLKIKRWFDVADVQITIINNCSLLFVDQSASHNLPMVHDGFDPLEHALRQLRLTTDWLEKLC